MRTSRRWERTLNIALAVVLLVLASFAVVFFRGDIASALGLATTATATPDTAAPTQAEPPAPPPPPPPSIAAPPKPPPPPPAPKPSAAPRPTEIGGKNADAWRSVLKGAATRGDGGVGAEAFVALATLEPERFADRLVVWDGAKAVHLAMATSEAVGAPVFEVLASAAFAPYGADVMYRLTSVHGGSRAARKAAELLKREDILKSATPALRIALDIRDAACRSRPALFDRAEAEGDKRALYLLLAMRGNNCSQISCCMKNDPELDGAINGIRARLGDAE